jgi:hypothetical protein
MTVTLGCDGVDVRRNGIFEESLLPRNVADIIAARRLMTVAFEAVADTDWPRESVTLERVLRTLTVFAYCRGIFSSHDIAAGTQWDADLRYLCANDFPTWQQVQQFRRANAKSLRTALARALQVVCDESGVVAPFFACVGEAERRIQSAIEADSAEMDA